MNTAAKEINQFNVFNGQLSKLRLSKKLCCMLFLLFIIVVNTLFIIYFINEYRTNFSELQQLKTENHQLQLRWGQLLLEQASLATPARIEAIALSQLHMIVPDKQHTLALITK